MLDWVQRHLAKTTFDLSDWDELDLPISTHLDEMVRRWTAGSRIQAVVGPPGTGKTLLAKRFFAKIAGTWSGKPVEIDCTEGEGSSSESLHTKGKNGHFRLGHFSIFENLELESGSENELNNSKNRQLNRLKTKSKLGN